MSSKFLPRKLIFLPLKHAYNIEHFFDFFGQYKLWFWSQECSRIPPPPPRKSIFFLYMRLYYGAFFRFFWPIIKCDFDLKRCHKCSRPPRPAPPCSVVFSPTAPIISNIFLIYLPIIKCDFDPKKCQKCLSLPIMKCDFDPKRCQKYTRSLEYFSQNANIIWRIFPNFLSYNQM